MPDSGIGVTRGFRAPTTSPERSGLYEARARWSSVHVSGGPDGEGKGWQRLAWWLERTNPEQFSVLEHFRGRTAPEPEANEDARHEKSTVDEIQQAIVAARTVIEAE